jgi:NTP pyrophosphatase (non-canonical NTP hydrolase)
MVLSADPSLAELQAYIARIEQERNFNESTVEKCLLLGEEVGELFKAVRAASGLGVDPTSFVGEIGGELADILFFLTAIANRCGVNLASAVSIKSEENTKRVWRKAPPAV